MKNAGYEFKEHTADVQVKSWGSTLEEAFSQTAYSLMATISPRLENITPSIEKRISIKAEDKEALLFDFLSEFLFIFDVEELIFCYINVLKIKRLNEKYELEAIIKGEKFDKQKHEIGTEVKAITYSYMSIEEKKKEIEINVVFDI
ncbi:MAG: archease [Candidatus Thorarchaeota archaeon]